MSTQLHLFSRHSAGTINEDGGIFSYAVKLATIPDGDVTVTPQAVGNLDINPLFHNVDSRNCADER